MLINSQILARGSEFLPVQNFSFALKGELEVVLLKFRQFDSDTNSFIMLYKIWYILYNARHIHNRLIESSY